MGLSHISPLSLLLILVIVLVVFGPTRLKNIGAELGSAIKNFRKGLEGEENSDKNKTENKTISNEKPDRQG